MVLCGCDPPAAAPRPDVVLVTLDTCRADRLGAYGHAAASTANLDALADGGRRYARAWSPAPMTVPAHGALFTGRYPSTLAMWTNATGLPAGVPTLAERFREAGYATAASVGAVVVDRRWGFDRGFDAYFDTGAGDRVERPGDEVVDDVLRWEAASGDRPRFVWVHLFDAHGPHLDPYDAEIAALDVQVGRLVAAFADRPTVFVVVGDHGESLGEHGEADHSLYVYDATQRVPWIVAGPGVAPEVVDEPVSLVDVAPTLLALLDLPRLDAEGRVAPGEPARPVFLESWALQLRFGLAPHRGVVDDGYKLVDLPRPELYRLDADPGELDDVADEHPDRVARLQALVRARPGLDLGTVRADATGLLAELGYVEAEPVPAGPLRDPKDHAALIGAVDAADALVAEGRVSEALAGLAEVAEAAPEVRELRVRRAELLTRLGRGAEALAVLDEGLVREPASAVLAEARAAALEALGRLDEAAAAYVALAEAGPREPGEDARAFAALLRGTDGRARALAFGVARAPGDPLLSGLVGVELARGGELGRARPFLVAGGRATPPARDVRLFLARLAHEGGDVPAARGHLEAELADHPNNAAATLALAMVLRQQRDWDGVLALTERVLARIEAAGAGPGFDVSLLWASRAEALARLGRKDEARLAVERGLALNAAQPDLLALAEQLGREGRGAIRAPRSGGPR